MASIVAALVARGPVILAEYTTNTDDRFVAITQTILEKIPNNNENRLSYLYDRYQYHYIRDNGIVYLCMADEQFGRRVAFKFLEDLKEQFNRHYSEEAIDRAISYGLSEFSPVIQARMDFYTNDVNSDAFRKAQHELNHTKDVLTKNIELALERGEQIDNLVDRSDNLNQAAFAFRKRSTALKRAMWWKNMKLMILIAWVLCMAVYFFVCGFCGFPGPAWSQCFQ